MGGGVIDITDFFWTELGSGKTYKVYQESGTEGYSVEKPFTMYVTSTTDISWLQGDVTEYLSIQVGVNTFEILSAELNNTTITGTIRINILPLNDDADKEYNIWIDFAPPNMTKDTFIFNKAMIIKATQLDWQLNVTGEFNLEIEQNSTNTGIANTYKESNIVFTSLPRSGGVVPEKFAGKLNEYFDLDSIYFDVSDSTATSLATQVTVDDVSYDSAKEQITIKTSITVLTTTTGIYQSSYVRLVIPNIYTVKFYAIVPYNITITPQSTTQPNLLLSDMWYNIIEGVKDYNFSLDYSDRTTSFSNGSVNIDFETTDYELTQEKLEKYSKLELSDTSYGYFIIGNSIGLGSGINKISISPSFNFLKNPGDYKELQLVYTYNDTEAGMLRQINKPIRLNGVAKNIKLSNLTIDSPIYYTPNTNVDIRYYPNFSIDVDTNLDTLNLEKLKMVHVQHETITGEYNLGEGGSDLAFEYINEDSLEYNGQTKKITGTFNLVIWTIPANHCFKNTYGIIYEDTDSGITSNEVSASWLLKDPALDSNYIIIPTEKKITQSQLNNIQNLDTSDYIATAYTGSFTNTYVLGEEPFIDTPDKIRIKIPENIEQYLNKTLIKNGYLGKHTIEIIDCSPSSGLSRLSDGEHNEIITKTNFIDCCVKKEDSDSGQSTLHYVYSLNPSTTDTPHEISCVKTGNKIVITQKVWATDLIEVIESEYSADYWVEFTDNQVYLDPSIVTTDELAKMNFSVTYQWLMVVQEG